MNTLTLRKTLQVVMMSWFVLSAAAAVSHAQAAAEFTPTDCPEMFAELPLTLECGLVAVPLEHDDPQRAAISLAVFRARSTSDAPLPDPLVMLQGGPGGSVNTLLVASAAGLTNILAERDLVFIEQRGNLYSSPSLTCSTYSEMMLASLAKTDTSEQMMRQREVVESCLSEFDAAGIDLAAFDSYENARDIPMVVIDALGYSSYNLYGVSYGSLLAQHVMELDPRGLRSVILDAVVPRDQDFDQLTVEHGWRAFKRLADACAADATCAANNPDLETTLLSLLERLSAEPINMTVTNPDSGEMVDIKFDDSLLAQVVFSTMYDTLALTKLPSQITMAERGDFSWAADMVVALLQPDFGVGLNWAVICSERSYAGSQPIISADVPLAFAQAMLEGIDNTELCSLVNLPLIPSEGNTPTDVDIPTLLMSGEYDPITPADYGRRVAETLPQSVHVEFPGIAHGAIVSGTCPASIAAAFLNNPTAELDLSCVEAMGLRFAADFALTERTVGTVTLLVPAEWTEVEPGAFTDMMSNFMLVQEDEGRVLEQQIGGLTEGLDEQQLGKPDQHMFNQYTWTIYRIRLESQGIVIFAAGTETDTRTYLVLIQGDLGSAPQLEESLLMPVLASFRAE